MSKTYSDEEVLGIKKAVDACAKECFCLMHERAIELYPEDKEGAERERWAFMARVNNNLFVQFYLPAIKACMSDIIGESEG